MPPKGNIQERRREMIRNILLKSDPPIEGQKELLERLKEKGIRATQSSVSRDLNEMGVMWIPGRYELPNWFDEDEPFRQTKGLIVRIVKVETTLLMINTQPGAGGFVAEAIEASRWQYVLSVMSGYSSVLVATENEIFRDVVTHMMESYLREKVGEEKEKS